MTITRLKKSNNSLNTVLKSGKNSHGLWNDRLHITLPLGVSVLSI